MRGLVGSEKIEGGGSNWTIRGWYACVILALLWHRGRVLFVTLDTLIIGEVDSVDNSKRQYFGVRLGDYDIFFHHHCRL